MKRKPRIWMALIALAVFLLDRVTKIAAGSLSDTIALIPGVIGLRYARNTGMAFSLFSGVPWVLGILSVALITAGYFLLRPYRLGPVTRTASMMVLGGALGNMADRFFTGYVVDMLEFLFVSFPVFNLADTFLVIGCVLLAWSLIFRPGEWEKKE